MPGLTWDQTEDLALALFEKFPDVDPLKVRFTDLHKWVTELDEFGDDPKARTRASWKRFRWRGTRSGKKDRFSAVPGPRAMIRQVPAGHP